MLRDDLYNLFVEDLSLFWMLLAQSVGFLEPVSHLMMEVHFLSELLEVLFLDFVVHVLSDLVFSGSNFESRLYMVDSAIVVEVISSGVSFWVLVHWLKVWDKNVLLIVLVINTIFQSQGSDRFNIEVIIIVEVKRVCFI